MKSAISQASATRVDTAAMRAFVEWAAERLDLELENAVGGLFSLAVPEEHRDAFNGSERVLFTYDPARYEQSGPDDVQLAAPGGQFVAWLRRTLTSQGHLSYAAPVGQPHSVHEISGNLFSAYTVDGGNVRLGGCHLEDRLVARLVYQLKPNEPSDAERQIELFIGPDGKPITPELIETLGICELDSQEEVPRVSDRQLAGLVAIGGRLATAGAERIRRTAAEQQNGALAKASFAKPPRAVLQSLDLITCKFVEGKLCFNIGEQTVEAAFAGWARNLTAPPCICPQTGRETYHLTLTDDGRPAAAEEIEACAASGRRVIRSELVRCTETGRWVLPEFIESCPISGEPVSKDALVTCSVCGQRVSPAVVKEGTCSACRGLESVGWGDDKLMRVVKAHPGLARWRRWQIAETHDVYVVVAFGLVQRLLVVVDKDNLEPRHAAVGRRGKAAWRPLESEQYADFLA